MGISLENRFIKLDEVGLDSGRDLVRVVWLIGVSEFIFGILL